MNKEYIALFGFLGWAVKSIEFLHWSQSGIGSYARHQALGELYDALQSKTDLLVEAVQSYTGILELKMPAVETPKAKSGGEILSFLRSVREQMNLYRKDLAKMPEIANLYEEMILAISHSIYKIENLS